MEEVKERRLSNWIDGYLELTDTSEPPEIFRKWVAVSVIAAALQRKCFFRRGFISIYPNFYIVLIGTAASRKGVAMGQGFSFVEKLNIPIGADSTSRQAMVKAQQRANRKLPDKETGESIEHSSITFFSEEFTVLIGYKDVEFLTILGNWYDCGRGERGYWDNETICRQLEVINGVWVNILGGTTPTLLANALPVESIGTGFISRVISVNFRGKIKKKPFKEFTPEQLFLKEKLHEDLKHIHELKGKFVFSPELNKFWDTWYVEKSDKATLDVKKFDSYLGRRAMHFVKLMIVLNASRTDSMIIEMEDFYRAKEMIEEIETGMGRTYESLGSYEYRSLLDNIIDFVKRKQTVLVSEIIDTFKFDADKRIIEGIIETLVLTKYIKRAQVVGKPGEKVVKWINEEKEGGVNNADNCEKSTGKL